MDKFREIVGRSQEIAGQKGCELVCSIGRRPPAEAEPLDRGKHRKNIKKQPVPKETMRPGKPREAEDGNAEVQGGGGEGEGEDNERQWSDHTKTKKKKRKRKRKKGQFHIAKKRQRDAVRIIKETIRKYDESEGTKTLDEVDEEMDRWNEEKDL